MGQLDGKVSDYNGWQQRHRKRYSKRVVLLKVQV